MTRRQNSEIRYMVRQGNKETLCEFRGTSETDRGTMLKMRPVRGGKDLLVNPQEVYPERQHNPSNRIEGQFGSFGDEEMRQLYDERTGNPIGTLEDGRTVIWVREAKPHEKGPRYGTLEDGRRVFWVREIKGAGRSANPYGVLKDGRPVLWVKEYLPHEVWFNEDNTVRKPKNTGDLLTELTGYPIRWMQGIGFVVLSGLQGKIPSKVVASVEKKINTKKFQELDAGSKVQEIYETVAYDLSEKLKDARKEHFKSIEGGWSKADKETRAMFYRDFFGEALAGANTTEAIENMNYHINLRNQAFLGGRLGDFLREHPQVIEAVVAGKRLGTDVLSDIEEHARRLGYANVKVRTDARGRSNVQLTTPRLQEMDRDIRAIVPYIQPQAPQRTNNPYLSYMVPRSGTDGGTQHREHGYVDYASNTYTAIEGSKWFEPQTEYTLVDDATSSQNLMKASSLLAFAEKRLSPPHKIEANRKLWDFIKAQKMSNKEFSTFVAFLAEHSDKITKAAQKIASAPKWTEKEGHYLERVISEAKKSPTPKIRAAAKKAEDQIEEAQEAAQEAVVAQEEAQEAAQEAVQADHQVNKAKTPSAKKQASEAAKAAKEAEKAAKEAAKEAEKAAKEAAKEAEKAAKKAAKSEKIAQQAVQTLADVAVDVVENTTAPASTDEKLAKALLPVASSQSSTSAPTDLAGGIEESNNRAASATAARIQAMAAAKKASETSHQVSETPKKKRTEEELLAAMRAAGLEV